MDWPRGRFKTMQTTKKRKRSRGGPRGHTLQFCGYDDACPRCDIVYRDFRTGYRYGDIWNLLVDNHDDPARWKYKRRNTILGLWHRVKMDLWAEHKCQCEALLAMEMENVPF